KMDPPAKAQAGTLPVLSLSQPHFPPLQIKRKRGVSRAAVRFPVQPRLIDQAKVARRLGVTEAVFLDRLPELLRADFPRPDAVLGTYCLEAVDKWIDARAGLTVSGGLVSDPSVIAERIKRRAWGK